MSDPIYFVQIEGADERTMEEVADKLGDVSDNNIVVTGKEIEPVEREDVRRWLEQFADALDMELKE